MAAPAECVILPFRQQAAPDGKAVPKQKNAVLPIWRHDISGKNPNR